MYMSIESLDLTLNRDYIYSMHMYVCINVVSALYMCVQYERKIKQTTNSDMRYKITTI